MLARLSPGTSAAPDTGHRLISRERSPVANDMLHGVSVRLAFCFCFCFCRPSGGTRSHFRILRGKFWQQWPVIFELAPHDSAVRCIASFRDYLKTSSSNTSGHAARLQQE